jgi:UDP-glucose 4-epimerase
VLVAVTGGTGFLGAHTVKAVRAAGHDVRLLVYPADSLEAVAAVGVDLDALDVLYGDVCDPAAVDQLLTGADAVIHAAGVVGVDERQAELMWRVNVTATQHVLATAVARGLDPVVHVASFICLFNGTDPVITADTATASGRSAYARTKGAADTFARGLQAAGAPVVVVYPSGIAGPPAGDRRGITVDGFAPLLWFGLSITFDGGVTLVDVRDVANVLARVLERGRGPRRYLCAGNLIRFDDALDAVEQATGRPVRRVRIRPRTLRALGRASDLAARWLPMAATFSYEGARVMTALSRTDDARTREELGLAWRPAAETLGASIEGLQRS